MDAPFALSNFKLINCRRMVNELVIERKSEIKKARPKRPRREMTSLN